MTAINLSTIAWGGGIMSLTPSEYLDEDLKERCELWKEMVKFFSDDYEPDAIYFIYKAGYEVVLKQMLHKNTLSDLLYFKLLIDATCEVLDEDTATYETGEKLKDGRKLNVYNFLKDMNEEYDELIKMATLIKLIPKCDNNRNEIGKHYDVYYAQLKSKLDKMVEDAKNDE